MTLAPTAKVWLITGASRGFGQLIAKSALERGDAVVATARQPTTLTEAVGESPNFFPVRLDVTSEPEAQQVAALTWTPTGPNSPKSPAADRLALAGC